MSSLIKNTPDKDGRYQYRVDILGINEAWVDDAISRVGGYRITDNHSFPEGIENCDYRIKNLFIELKILERDVFESPERQKKMIQFFEREGLLDESGAGTVDSAQLSADTKKRLWDITMNGIEGVVKKANRQIKATAKHLGIAKFKGVILLVNKECESIEALTLKRYAEYIIHKEKFSSLHHVVCFSAIPAVALGSPPVIGFVISEIKDEETALIIDAIMMAFRSKAEEALGKKLAMAPNDIGHLSNIREDRSFTHGPTTVTFASGSLHAIEQNRDKMKDRRGEKPI